jgi:DNA polymerase III sliding clamp (beta) subunit (PCNA family)
MEFVVDVSVIRDAISKIFDVAPSKNHEGSPVGLKINAKEDGIVTFVINDITLVSSSAFSADVKVAGEVIVGLVQMFKAVTGFTPYREGKGTKVLKIKKGTQNLFIKAQTFYSDRSIRQKRVLSFLDTVVTDLKIITQDKFVEIPIAAVSTCLRHTMFSVASNSDGGGFAGVLFSLVGDKIYTAGMNGVCLTECKVPVESSLGEETCILESVFVAKLSKLLYKITKENKESQMQLLITDRMFLFKSEGFMVGSSILVALFPDYSSILSTERKSFVINTEILLDNLRNVMYSADKTDDFRTTLKFFDGQLIVSTIECENEGILLEKGIKGNLQIDFNVNLLEGSIRSLASEYIEVEYTNRKAPVILKPYNNDSDVHLLSIVAPLR